MIHWKELTREGRIEAIRSVWFPGCSTAQIAANFADTTRNAIIGVYNRYGKEFLSDKPLRSHAAADADKKHKNRRARKAMRFLPVPPKPLPPLVEIAFEHRLCGKPLLKLGANECKWSVNDASGEDLHIFCGMPADGSYCHHHRTRAHQPRTP